MHGTNEFLLSYHNDKLTRYKDRIFPDGEMTEQQRKKKTIEFSKKSLFYQYNVPFHELEVLMGEEIFEKKVREFDLIEETMSKPIDLYDEVMDAYIQNIDKQVYQKGLSFVFFGPNESSKTLTALHCLCSGIEKSMSGYYIFFKDLLNLHNNSEFQRESENVRLWNHVLNCDFLVIDEVGKESSVTDNVIGVFEKVIKYRNSEIKPTVIVSNIFFPKRASKDQNFLSRYGNSVYNTFKTRYRVFQFSKKGKFRERTRVDWDL